MALDIYAGPLTRYYTRDWENVAQRQARERGLRYSLIRPDGDEVPPTTAEVLELVGEWRDELNRSLESHLKVPLTWDDSPTTPYLTDRPGYGCYAALVLWAAYAGRTDVAPPETIGEDWFSDAVFVEACEKASGTRYRQILQSEVWFPCDFDFAFKAPTPVADEAWLGSSLALLRQLDALNGATFRASEPDLIRFLTGEFEAPTETEHAAKVGLAMFSLLAKHSVEYHVPMLLDQ